MASSQRAGGGGGQQRQLRGGPGYPSLDGQDDMARRLQEALRDVEESAFHMNRAIDGDNLTDALKFSQNMLRELRVSNLSPKTYYELWMKIFDHLRQLHSYFLELNKKGTPMADLYQKVQSTNHIIPRLYLMITVGSAFIITLEAPSKDILQDLIEMTKGVQHPLRGLFLRNYLLKMTQDKLVKEFDVSTDFSISFILQNFGEMNRLWVRMQHQGNAKNRTRREKERQDLKVLISYNLVRLSEFEGMNLDVYNTTVLTRILDLVTNCKDKIAQQYLIDVLIQIFPASYHLETLDKLLDSFEHLEPAVDIKSLLISLMERVKYREEDDDDEDQVEGDASASSQSGTSASNSSTAFSPEAFKHINGCIEKTMAARKDMSVEDILDLQVGLLDFAVTCYPGELDYIDRVLGFCSNYLQQNEESASSAGNVVDVLVVQLLKVPLKQKELGSIDLLELSHFPSLMNKLSWQSKKKVAHGFLLHVLQDKSLTLDSEDNVTKLLTFIAPLIMDDEKTASDDDAESATFQEQQYAVAKLVHRLRSQNTQALFKILGIARKHFGKGGVKRIRYTLVPLCFKYFMLVNQILTESSSSSGSDNKGGEGTNKEGEEENNSNDDDDDPMAKMLNEASGDAVSLKKVFQYIHEIVSALAGVVSLQEVALRLFLQAAETADLAKQQEIAYEFMAQAFTLYEDIADSKEQIRTLPLLIGTLQRMTVFDKESFETLITKTTQYGARMLKKNDQCKMIYLCSHLFWSVEPKRQLLAGEDPPVPGQDGKRTTECLKRCLKIADSCVQSSMHVALFVEILNRYIYFFDHGMEEISTKNIADLVKLIKSNMQDAQLETEEQASLDAFFANTIKHLKSNPEKYQDVGV